MDNAEEIMQCLEEFSKMKPKDIPHELDDYLGYVAKTGDPVFKWSIVKCLFREKLLNVITNFYETTLSVTELPPCPNVDPFNYERMKANLLEKLDSFHGAPFTVQRISELLTNPRREYNRADKFMRAIEKNILVVSTREPGRLAEGECENDPSFNGIPDANDSGVETGFPCNDLVETEAAPQSFDSAENIEPAFNVNVDVVDTSGSSGISSAPHDEPSSIATSETREVLDAPGTSGESSKIVETPPNDDKESVICSTETPPSLEHPVDNVQPMSTTSDVPTQIQETSSIENPVPSTSEAVPVPQTTSEPLPSTSVSTVEMDTKEEASSSQETEVLKSQPQAEEMETTSSQEAAPAEEPSSSDSENLVVSAETPEETPVVSSNDQSEVESKEAASVTEEKSECDSNEVSEETSREKLAEEESSAAMEQAEEKTVSSKDDEAGVALAADETEVTSCADSSAESTPVVDESGEPPRETSVIHTTSPDEPMEVDECQTSSSEQPQP